MKRINSIEKRRYIHGRLSSLGFSFLGRESAHDQTATLLLLAVDGLSANVSQTDAALLDEYSAGKL